MPEKARNPVPKDGTGHRHQAANERGAASGRAMIGHPSPGGAAHLLRLQRSIGNAAVATLVVQRDTSQAGSPTFSNLDTEVTRWATMSTNDFLLHKADFAPVIPTKIQTWKTISVGGQLDEDHFYTDNTGAEQHVKVLGGMPDSTTIWGEIVNWDGNGQQQILQNFSGWLEDNGDGTCQVHTGAKPSTPSPSGPDAPSTPSGPPLYDNADVVPV
jgi:hypothetical protein